jgi:cytochrome c-type biogenesis protein CcmH/NrfG
VSGRKSLPTSAWAWIAGVGVMAAMLLALAYANALDGAFVFDDEVSIVENSSIRRLWPLRDVLVTKAEGGRTHDSRPLLNLSLAIDYAVHGLWRPGFRIVNLAIHLGNVLLIFDVARRILRLSGLRLHEARMLAAITAVLWAVHPLHTAVNTYVIQRAESLATLFILAAFDAAIVSLARGSLAVAAIAGLLAIVGASAKETTAAILPLVAAFDWAFRDRLPAADRDRGVRPVLYAGLALNVAAIIGLAWALGGRGGSAGLTTASVVAYALTQCRAIWLYLGKLFWPATLVLDHGEWLAAGPGEVWPFVVATAALVAGVAIGFGRKPRAFFPLVAAAILLGPTTSIVPVKTQTIAEHRMYLPAVFLIGGLVTAVAMAARRAGGQRWQARCRVAGLTLVAVLVAASVGRTIVRNRDFTTAASLWQQNVRDCPENDRGVTNLVAALIRERRFDEAAPLAQQAVADHPERERNWLNLGRILAEEHRNDAAADAFAEAIRLAPGEADARINLGIVLSRGADLDTAIAMLDEAIRLRPDLAKGWLARGMVRLRQERPDLALGDLETAVRLDPENPAGCANLDLARRAIESL